LAQVRGEHRVERVLWGPDQVAELSAEFALARWIPCVMAVFDEDLGVLRGTGHQYNGRFGKGCVRGGGLR
jgi:hypothetical protein